MPPAEKKRAVSRPEAILRNADGTIAAIQDLEQSEEFFARYLRFRQYPVVKVDRYDIIDRNG